jgi:hypothetical protein
VDTNRMQLLEQFLVDLDQSSGAAPADVKTVLTEASSALHRLRKYLQCEQSKKVAQLARDGDLDGALETMLEHFPDLKISIVIDILKLLYNDEKDLLSTIRFVERLGVEFRREAYEAVYENVRLKGHTEMLEMLLLQKNMSQILAGESETMKQLDEDCDKIVERIVEGVKTEDYELCTKIIEFGGSILDGKMVSIVVKVHSTSTLKDTLLLINFSQGLPEISNQSILIRALFQVLEAKNLLRTEHGLHIWSHLRSVLGQQYLPNEDTGDRDDFTFICTKLDKNKDVYFEIYRDYVEDPDGDKIKTLHDCNWQLLLILPEFVDSYYDGDLDKASVLLSAVQNICFFSSRFKILNSLYKKMSHFDQLDTFEAFRIFTVVKENLRSASLWEQEFEELQAEAPLCLRLLLWPEPAGAKFWLVNKFLDAPLHCTKTRVFCGPPSATRISDQLWRAKVDPSTGLTAFKMRGRRLSFSFLNGKPPVGQANKKTEWKIKAVDEHHIKLYFEGNLCTVL